MFYCGILLYMNETQDKNEVMSLVAHELRTSLTSLKWMLKMLLDSDFGPITEEQKNALTQGFAQNEHMIEVVTDLINFTHSEETSIPYKKESIDIAETLERVIKEFASESFKRGVPVLFTKPQSPIIYTGDNDKIKIVFQNLISNAIKYSRKGDGVEIALTKTADIVIITIRDHGIGIPSDAATTIFTKFFRASNAKEKESIGSGLGLYTAYNIVVHHGGTLTYTSTEGLGTTFVVSLPLV